METLSLKKIYDKLKKVKNIEYFLLILAIAIVVSMLGSFFNAGTDDGTTAVDQRNIREDTADNNKYDIFDKEERLKKVLSAIKGAGEVEVMISYKSSKEIIPAMNTVQSSTQTEETDSSGGTRKITQTDTNTQPVSLSTQNGSQPLIAKEMEPEIQGVIVVAEGADDFRVKIELLNAVQTVLGLKANQVEVFDMEDKN
ncbi:MAG TPA: stage III sporulation protein AG [Candidatus Atribacteria bacterium]|nr:stage III sporulation protein AG [Candidatus Atribacteria bacterium]HPT77881.1 stage III sporulation protein AG [Candidatus Atribacteria bacterium]